MMMELPCGCSSLMLHSCCAPCSGAILESMVQSGIRPVVFFSNSNIVPMEEYELRKEELIRYCRHLDLAVIDDDYDHACWLEAIRGLEKEPERGRRCSECFRFRLLRAAGKASELGCDVLATTLASSRWKDLDQVNDAGQWACSQVKGVQWWGANFRKGGLQPRRSEIIREQNFYNQLFCGCEFSRRDNTR